VAASLGMRVAAVAAAVAAWVGAVGPAHADWWPEGWYDEASRGRPGYYPDIDVVKVPFYWDTAAPFEVLSVGFIRFYQTSLSRFRTGDCPFQPSCSRYTLRAIHDHGPFWGWLMAIDRIFYRENGAIYRNYPRVMVHEESRPYDPPKFDWPGGDVSWPLVGPSDGQEW